MKTLYLLRHAKSSWKNEDVPDRDRPLKKKGHLHADAMSDHLASLIPPPTFIACSPAKRTRETLAYFLELWTMDSEDVTFPDELYLANADVLKQQVTGFPEASDVAMIVGHNPGLTDLVHEWTASSVSAPGTIRTCGFLQIDFEVSSWKQLEDSAGTVKLDLRPKDL
jgi:phosphohistidine phosphatase